MKPEDPRHPWSRLVAAARQARDERDTSAPYGFATRIAALAYAQERNVASFVERFAWRAVAVSGALALLSVAMNYSALTAPPARIGSQVAAVSVDDFMLPVHDPVAVVLDVAE